MPTTTVNDWGEAVMTSFSAALAMFLGAVPKVIGFLVILVIGWIVATALAKAVSTILHTVNFNGLAQRSGFSGFVSRMGVHQDASDFIATIAKWFVRLIVMVVAFDALGLPAVSAVLQQLLLWLPNLVVALVVLVIAGLAANALASLVRGATSESGLGSPDFLSNLARVAVWVFGIVVAVNQLGIATTLVNTLFMGFVGALALALGLAFGLGGRDTAAEVVRNWYTKGRQAAPRLAETADVARRQAQEPTVGAGAATTVPPAYTADSTLPTGGVRTSKND